MTIEYVDHVTVGQERVVSYFKTKENFLKLLEIYLNQLQDLEDKLTELANIKDVDNVTGIWLDYLGKILGEDRDNLSDEVYRANLKLRIAINTSDGTAPVLRSIVKTFTDSDSVRIAEGILSYGQLIFDGYDNATKNLYDLMEDIVPVSTKILVMQNTAKSCFFPAWEVDVSNVDVFDAVVSEDLTETLELILTDLSEPSTFFVSLDGSESVLDPETTDAMFLGWEENDLSDFYFSTGEPFEVTLDELGTTDTLVVKSISSTVRVPTYLPWELQEDSNVDSFYDPELQELIDYYGNSDNVYELFVDLKKIPIALPETPEDTLQEVLSVTLNNITTTTTSPELTGTVGNVNSTVTVIYEGIYYQAVNNGDGSWVLPENTIEPLSRITHLVEVKAELDDIETSSYGIITVESEETVASLGGVQIGDYIIHSEDYWTDSEDNIIYTLLPLDGSTFDETLYPELYEILGTNVLESLDNPEGSEVGYKVVADL